MPPPALELGRETILQRRPDPQVLLKEEFRRFLPLKQLIKIRPDEAEGIGSPFLASMYMTAGVLDEYLSAHHRELTFRPIGESSPEEQNLFTLERTKEQVTSDIDGCLNFIVQEARAHPDSDFVYAFPMAGAVPLMRKLNEAFYDYAQNKLFAVSIEGSVGTSSGKAQIAGSLSPELLDSNKTVVVVDDVGDTLKTLVELALTRRKQRLLEDTAYDDLPLSISQNKEKHLPFSSDVYQGLNKRIVKLLADEKVIFAPIYYKNQPFKEALQAYWSGEEVDQSLSSLQLGLIGKAVDIPQDHWVMGAGLLDTPVTGKEVLECLVKKGYDKIRNRLEQQGLACLTFRIGGGMEDLVALNTTKEGAYQELVSLISQLVGQYAQININKD